VAGTIDLIIMNMNDDDYIDKNLLTDFFKVCVKLNPTKKLKKNQLQKLEERQKFEKKLGITQDNMFFINETEKEILYVKK